MSEKIDKDTELIRSGGFPWKTGEEIEKMEGQNQLWTLCVVAQIGKKPNRFKTFYLGINGTREEAEEYQNIVAKRGFKSEEKRFFADQIESVSIKETENNAKSTD